jgi:hypothetical protein
VRLCADVRLRADVGLRAGGGSAASLNVAPAVGVADSPEPELGLTTPLPGTTPELGLVFVPAPESVGDGLPVSDGDGDTDGDGDCDGLDDGLDDGDVAGWDGGAELAGVLGPAGCDGACEAPAVGDTL